MKRKITFLIAAIAAIMLITQSFTAVGQQATLSFASNEWELPEGSVNGIKGPESYTYEDYTITLEAADKFYWNSSDKYVLFGKKNSTLTLPAFSFNVKKIKVYGNSGASASTTQNIYVGSTAVSTQTTSAKVDHTYVINSSYQTAGNIYVLKVTNAYNTQVKKIEVFQAYTVAYQAGDHGSGTMTDNNTYAEGDEVTLLTNSFTPAGGYEFSNWLVKDAEDHTITVTNNKFTMPASNVTITAQWANSGPVQLATPTGFSATPGNAQIAFSWNEVEHASSYTISYTTDGESWTDIEGIDETSYTKTGLSNNTEYTCKIKAAGDGSSYSDSEYSSTITATPTSATYYTISITSPITGGSVDSSVASATSGTTVTLTATPATGYGFNNIAASWSVIDSGDEPVSVTPGANNTATFTMPTSNVTVNATFTAYVVTLNAGTGTVNGNSTDTWTIATNDGNLPNAVSPNGDWSFGGWSTTQVSSETTVAPSYVATAYEPTSSITLYAVYTKTSNNDIETTLNVADYADDHNWSSGTQYTSASISPITFTITGGGNDGKYYNSDESWRIYSSSSGTITITSSGNNVHSVTSSPTRTFTISNGAASYSGSDTKFTSIVVTTRTVETSYYSNPLLKVATPNITLAAGTYTEVKTTTITCDTDQATIYYTTDGTVPSSTNGEEYTAAITIDESMTIKAIAVKDGMANSDVASKDYIINLPLTTMDAIYAKASENNGASKDVTVIFNNWVVSGVNGSTAYITDNAGKGFIIYKSGHGLAVNDKLNGTVSDTPLKLYNGAAQFTNISKTDLTVSDGSITVQTTTIADISGVNTGAVITINNVKYDGTNLEDPSNSNIEIKPYNGLEYNPSFTNNHNYNVTGVYLQYNSTKEIMPRSAADVVEVEYDITLTQPQAGGTIGTQGDITTAKFGQEVTLTSTPADHYRFVLWTVMNGETPVAVNNNKFTMPKAPVTVTATFVQLYGITIDDDIENGTVSVVGDVTEAAENDNITLTITPEDGYALKTLTVYKTGDQSTTVSVSNNAFTMPAYAVTVTAEFGAEYTITYYRNAVNDDDTAEFTYGEGADVTILAYDDNDVDFEAPEGKKFVKWTANADGSGTEYQPDDVIDDIAADYDLYAQWDDIIYHITYNVNGDTSETEDVDYGESTTYQPSLEPLTFIGWKRDDVMVGKTYTPTGITEDITLVAVFGATSEDDITLEVWNDMSTSYPDSEATWPGNQFKYYNVTKGQYTQDTYIQFKSAGGVYL